MKYKTVLDSAFPIVDARFQVLDSTLCQRNLDSGFLSLSGGISDSLSCVPNSKIQHSWFHNQIFLDPDFLAQISQIPSLPADVLWGSFVTQRNECVTNESQRTSSGRLLRGMLFIDRFFLFWYFLLFNRNSLCLHEVPMKEGSLKWVFLILWGVELRSLAPLEFEEVPL